MKQVSSFILLAIAGINTCGAMSPKNAKINPAVIAAAYQVGACPVLFIKTGMLHDKVHGSKEYHDLQKKMEKCQQDNPNVFNQEMQLLGQKQEVLREKLVTIATEIAKQKNACALLQLQDVSIYVNPSFDITNDAINELNKSYVASPRTRKTALPQEQLYEGILNNSEEEISEAVQCGANVNYVRSGKYELYWAITLKKPRAVKALLQNGVIVDATYIQIALDNGDYKSAIAIAIKCGSNLNAIYSTKHQKGTLAEYAVIHYAYDLILELMRHGAKVTADSKGISGRSLIISVLHWHTNPLSDSFALIQEFIKQGYNINQIWSDSFDLGSVYTDENLNFVIKNGAHPNHVFEIKDGYGKTTTWTPLLAAIKCGSFIGVKTLLEAGANVNQKTCPFSGSNTSMPQGSQSPLSYAIAQNQTQIIPLLLKYGAYAQ